MGLGGRVEGLQRQDGIDQSLDPGLQGLFVTVIEGRCLLAQSSDADCCHPLAGKPGCEVLRPGLHQPAALTPVIVENLLQRVAQYLALRGQCLAEPGAGGFVPG